MHKVLVAGCGNIGAMYDWNTDSVLTHAKAFSMQGENEVFFFDIDREQATRVAERYHGQIAPVQNGELKLSGYDVVSVCTPTAQHFPLLKRAMEESVPVIICEKPVSLDAGELVELPQLYALSESKVLVNYMRRFQPAFKELRSFIDKLTIDEPVTNISIRYQRGFINNCSHALDLLAFLFRQPFIPASFVTARKDFDHFKNDPTLTAYAEWIGANVGIFGLQGIGYGHFEIDLHFKQYKIQFRNAGDVIDIFKAPVAENGPLAPLQLQTELSRNGCIHSYMLPVVQKAISLVERGGDDNFLEALQLNTTMLNLLNNQHHG
ncbi:Gfo/Idh/MocA family oxidoreductase [Sediminibacterium roseum]|uniref:Gfo/Idh/MocA family oxidoreductase n=1 Tax=Sediminibacterium roseum TaxID=1978412 RepID=A0ABW9ZW15_9BACT|nr:Gfo/Idh/MocA family oxidoreductase [Sediminibacterium roseum]NCI49071.1 Gfo/Idh/MocA family oxidoreductase [Sediminibacterium roseum]